MSRYCHPHFVPASTLNPTAPRCPVLWKRVAQFNGGAMLRTVSRSSQCRPVDDFVLWYGSSSTKAHLVNYCAASSTTSVLWPILRAAVSSTMVTSGSATTTSHSTMSRLRSILWLWSDPMGVPGSIDPFDPCSQHHVVLHYGSMVWRHSILCRHGSAASSTTVLWICGMSGPILSYAWIYGMSGPILCLCLELWYVWSMDLWYVWSYPMPGSMVCLVRSYVWSYPMSGAMVCVVYGSVVCLVLSYVWICGMSGPVVCRPGL